MADFYVTLPSSVPNPQFKNTSSRYITRLPEVLNLERDKYVVAATDIIYPYSYINVGKPLDYWIHFKSNRLPIRVTFPPSQYSDATQIVNTLNDQQTTRLKRSAVISFVEKEVSRAKRAKKRDVVAGGTDTVDEYETMSGKNQGIENVADKPNIVAEYENMAEKSDIAAEYESLASDTVAEYENLTDNSGTTVVDKQGADIAGEYESIPEKQPPDAEETQPQPPKPTIYHSLPIPSSLLKPPPPSPPIIITPPKDLPKETSERIITTRVPGNQSTTISVIPDVPIVKEAPNLPSYGPNIIDEYAKLEEEEEAQFEALAEYEKFNKLVLNKPDDETIYTDTLQQFRKVRSKLSVETKSSSKEFLKFHDVGDQLEIQFLDNDISFVEFDEPCAYFLGFVDPIVRKTQKAAKKIDYFGNVSTIYLYCDVIDPIIVGNTKSALLSVIPCRGAYGEMIHYTVTHPRYLPLIKSNIDSIRVDLLTEFSEPIDFNWGSTIIVLHFKRI